MTSPTRDQKASRPRLTPLLVPGQALRLGMGPAEHVGRLGGARGVSGPARTVPEGVSAEPESSGFHHQRARALRPAHRDLLVEGRASEVAVGVKGQSDWFPRKPPWTGNRVLPPVRTRSSEHGARKSPTSREMGAKVPLAQLRSAPYLRCEQPFQRPTVEMTPRPKAPPDRRAMPHTRRSSNVCVSAVVRILGYNVGASEETA